MNWKNLKDNACPKCYGLLIHEVGPQRYRCSHDIGHQPCDFKISEEKFNDVVTSLYRTRPTQLEDDNLSELNNL